MQLVARTSGQWSPSQMHLLRPLYHHGGGQARAWTCRQAIPTLRMWGRCGGDLARPADHKGRPYTRYLRPSASSADDSSAAADREVRPRCARASIRMLTCPPRSRRPVLQAPQMNEGIDPVVSNPRRRRCLQLRENPDAVSVGRVLTNLRFPPNNNTPGGRRSVGAGSLHRPPGALTERRPPG